MTIRNLLIGIFALLAVACKPQQLVENMAPRDDQQLARAAIDDLVMGRSAALAGKMPEEIRPSLAAAEPQMRAMLPPHPAVRLVQANWSKTVGGGSQTKHQSDLVYELSGGGRYVLAELAIQRDGPTATISGFHVQPTDGPVDSWSGLSLKGKSAVHYSVLAAAIAAVGVTIWALVRIWRSGLFRRRWLWTIGALLGFTKLSIDWATGDISFMPISVQLFSASMFKTATVPWQVGVSIPLVAIWALLVRQRDELATAEEGPSAPLS
jgi:hypothetical protein